MHTHADLIVGLPGETFESFGAGFDQLAKYGPDEIQVGILKRLKGTPISRHDLNFKMIYSDMQPYQILSTSTMDYVTLQKMNRFAKFWDLYANSGEFKNFMLWLKQTDSLFDRFFKLSEHLSLQFTETHSLSLMSLAEQAWLYMLKSGVDEETAAAIIEKDFCFGAKRRDKPVFLKKTEPKIKQPQEGVENSLAQRQLKHLNLSTTSPIISLSDKF